MQDKEATVTVSSQEYARFQQLESELSYVKQQLADLQRLIFGKSSERFIPSDSNQLTLFSTPEPEVIPSIEQVSYERRKAPKEKPVRALLPAHLPRQEEIIEPEELCEG